MARLRAKLFLTAQRWKQQPIFYKIGKGVMILDEKKIEEILQVSLDGTPLPRTLWIQKVNKAHDTLDTTFAFKVWQKWGERLTDFYTQK